LAGPSRPLGLPEIPQFYLPGGTGTLYTPRLYGCAHIHFSDRRRKIDETRRVAFMVPLEANLKTVDWDAARPTEILPEQLLSAPARPASYLPLPSGAMELNRFTRWAKNFDRWLARTQRLEVTPKADGQEPTPVRPKRGGVSVDLVAIVWELA
jgi:hypothetical protein